MFVRNQMFEIVSVANEHMAIPVGDEATSFHGVVSLSEPAMFMLGLLNEPRTREDLIAAMLNEYEVDRPTIENDLDAITGKLLDMGLLLNV